MPQDLSYINEQPSEAQEEAITQAVGNAILQAMADYLNEIADTMVSNNIKTLNAETIRAMSEQFTNRITNEKS
jgi:uncharacterized protein YggE